MNKPTSMQFLNRPHTSSGSAVMRRRGNQRGLSIQISIPAPTASGVNRFNLARNETNPLPSPFPSEAITTAEASFPDVSGLPSIITSPIIISPEPYTDSPDATAPTLFVVSTIIPSFLYLGPEPTSIEQVDELEKLGVRRVLNMAEECEDSLGMKSRFEVYRKLGMRDTVEEQGVAQGLKDACDYIDDALLHGCPVYIHCRVGRSRSVTVVIAYLIHHYRWSLKTAYAYVLERRRGISPNIGFMAELMAFEEIEFGIAVPSTNETVENSRNQD